MAILKDRRNLSIGLLSLVIGFITFLLFQDYSMRYSSRVSALFSFSIYSDSITLIPSEERYIVKEFVIPGNTYLFEIIPKLSGETNILHHVILSYTGKRDEFYFCPRMNAGLFSSGKELVALSLPFPYGFFLKKGEKLLMEAHFANSTNEIVRGSLELTLKARSKGSQVTSLHLVAGIPVEGFCRLGRERLLSYVISQGLTQHEARLEKPFIAPQSRRLVYWSGHVHEHGVFIKLLRNGKVIGELFPKRDEGVIHREGVYVGGRVFTPPLELQKGDTIDLSVIYKKPRDLFIPDAMGIGYLVFR